MKLTREQIEAIALREYPDTYLDGHVFISFDQEREAFIKGMEMMQEMLTNEVEKETMSNEPAIKSVTICPTCGTECNIGGDSETHFYIPKMPIDLHEQIRVLQADKEIRDANQERLDKVNRELVEALESIVYRSKMAIKMDSVEVLKVEPLAEYLVLIKENAKQEG